jgi:D-alanine transaminase
VTRQASEAILNGITRLAVIKVMEEHQLRLVERPFSVAEAKRAREAFITSTTAFVLPVVRIDDTVVGDGKPGPLTRRLREFYVEHVEAEGRQG